MSIIIQQLKGKEHKDYIYKLAFEIWEKEFKWVNIGGLDDCIRLALKRHRESLPAEQCDKPPILPKSAKKKCEVCGCDIGQTEIVHYTKLCVVCWRRTFSQHLRNN